MTVFYYALRQVWTTLPAFPSMHMNGVFQLNAVLERKRLVIAFLLDKGLQDGQHIDRGLLAYREGRIRCIGVHSYLR